MFKKVGRALEAKKYTDVGTAQINNNCLELHFLSGEVFYIELEDLDLLTKQLRQKVPILKKVRMS
jgi:hypothetical protein